MSYLPDVLDTMRMICVTVPKKLLRATMLTIHLVIKNSMTIASSMSTMPRTYTLAEICDSCLAMKNLHCRMSHLPKTLNDPPKLPRLDAEPTHQHPQNIHRHLHHIQRHRQSTRRHLHHTRRHPQPTRRHPQPTHQHPQPTHLHNRPARHHNLRPMRRQLQPLH